MAVHIALNEINADFELVNVSVPSGQPKSKVLLDVNARGSVPVLQINDFILREGVAILLNLLDNNKNNLLPKSGTERDLTLEWLCFANSTLHPAYSRVFFIMRNLGSEASKNSLYAPTIKNIQNYWDEIEEHLKKSEYLTGNQITIADILLTVIANWSRNFEAKIIYHEKTKAYFTKIISLPSYKKALEIEGIKYVANL